MRSKYAHKLVAETAAGLAGAIYDECAQINEWYHLNPSRDNFVRTVAPDLIRQARDVLAEMLGRSDVPQPEKDIIYEALLRDAALPRGNGQTMH